MHFAAQSPFMMKNVKRFVSNIVRKKVVQLLGYDMPYFDLNFSKDALGLLCDEDRMEVEHAIMSAKSRHIGIKVYSPVKEKTSCLKWYKIEGWEDGTTYCLLFGECPRKPSCSRA